MKWIVQNNFRTDSEDSITIKKACENLGFQYEGVKVIPFSGQVPTIEDGELVTFYGGTGWINCIYKHYKNIPGIFFNPQSTFDFWIEKYGNSALNYGANITTIRELINLDYADDTMLFIRPLSDLKEFSGSMMQFSDIKNCVRIHHIFTIAILNPIMAA